MRSLVSYQRCVRSGWRRHDKKTRKNSPSSDSTRPMSAAASPSGVSGVSAASGVPCACSEASCALSGTSGTLSDASTAATDASESVPDVPESAQDASEQAQGTPEAAETPETPEGEAAADIGRVESLEGLFFRVFLSWRRHPERTQRWYDTKLRMATLKGKRFVSILHQEFPSEPTEAFIQSGRPVFDSEILTRQVKRLREEEARRQAEGLPPWGE